MIGRVLETAVYVDDLFRSRAFYQSLLAAAPMLESERLVAFPVGAESVLLLFRRGSSEETIETDGGTVPGHGAVGAQHFAFAVASSDLEAVVARVLRAGVEVESRVRWPAGGESVYFRDPDGHSVELATPGIWRIY